MYPTGIQVITPGTCSTQVTVGATRFTCDIDSAELLVARKVNQIQRIPGCLCLCGRPFAKGFGKSASPERRFLQGIEAEAGP